MRSINYKAKKCPRCGTKNNYTENRCTSCGLVFSRVENGSNKIAKGLLMAGKKDEVVLARMFPNDVRKKKFMLLCGFLGIFGAHNFYVGRYIKAIYMLIVGIASCVLASLNIFSQAYDTFMSFFFVFPALLAYFWIEDFVLIALNKYKVPVALEKKE